MTVDWLQSRADNQLLRPRGQRRSSLCAAQLAGCILVGARYGWFYFTVGGNQMRHLQITLFRYRPLGTDDADLSARVREVDRTDHFRTGPV